MGSEMCIRDSVWSGRRNAGLLDFFWFLQAAGKVGLWQGRGRPHEALRAVQVVHGTVPFAHLERIRVHNGFVQPVGGPRKRCGVAIAGSKPGSQSRGEGATCAVRILRVHPARGDAVNGPIRIHYRIVCDIGIEVTALDHNCSRSFLRPLFSGGDGLLEVCLLYTSDAADE